MSIVVGVGAPGTLSSASGGKVLGYNNLDDTTPVQVAPANAARIRIIFHNPGENDVLVYPTVNALGAANAPTVAAPGGAFRVFSNGGTLEVSGECQTSWAALSVGEGSTNPLTVMDSNV